MGLPSYADGGIPIWILSNSSSILATGIEWREYCFIFILITLLLVLFVSFIETFVIKKVLEIKSFRKIFGITLKANIVSTIAGTIVTYFLITNENMTSLLWWSNKWYILNNLLLHILMLIISYFIEYNVAKFDLKDFAIGRIKKSFLYANILSYILFPVLIIILMFVFGFFYDIHQNNAIQEYEKINFSGLNNIVVTQPAFIPTPVAKQECNIIRKTYNIKINCDRNQNYWASAVKTCGGIEHMYSKNQFEEIVKLLYTNNYHNFFFNIEVAEKYGLPADFLPPEILKNKTFSQEEFEKYEKDYPFSAKVWLNDNLLTGSLYSRTGHSEYIRKDNQEKVYAICIDNN